VIEMYKGAEYTQAKKQTRFGKLIDGTQYGEYSIDNEFLRDNDNFIESMTGKCKFWCCINYMGVDYGVWFSDTTGYLYINTKVDGTKNMRFCFTTQDHT